MRVESGLQLLVADLGQYCRSLVPLAAHSAALARPDGRRNSFTEATLPIDRLLEDALLGFLRHQPLVGSAFSEESGWHELGDGPLTAVVDPLDGSKNFAMDLGYYATAVALVDEDRRCVAGVVTNLAHGRVFSTIRNGGAFADGRPIRSAGTTLAASDAIFVGLSRTRDELAALTAVAERTNSFRAMGSAALDLCCLAAGHCGLFVDLSSTAKLVDVLASALIAEEAGAAVVTGDGCRVLDVLAEHGHLELETVLGLVRPRIFGFGSEAVAEEALPYLRGFVAARVAGEAS
jgi:myo-inositol-1(or 4)-monophosphatase